MDPVSGIGLGVSLLSQLFSGPGIAESIQNADEMFRQAIEQAKLNKEITDKQHSIEDITSPYNRGILSLFMKQAQALAPSQDTFAAQARGTEGLSYGTGTLLGKMMAKDAQRKATDTANTSFTQFYTQNQGNAQSLLAMRLNQQNAIADRFQKQGVIDQAQRNDTRDWWSSFGNELTSLSGIFGSERPSRLGGRTDQRWGG